MSDLSRKIQYLVQFVALLSLGLLAFTAAAQPAIVEACKACHAEDGSGVGKRIVPIIAGMPAVHIEEALYA